MSVRKARLHLAPLTRIGLNRGRITSQPLSDGRCHLAISEPHDVSKCPEFAAYMADKRRSDIYRDGAMAGRDDLSEENCPHPPETHAAWLWRLGWREAKEF